MNVMNGFLIAAFVCVAAEAKAESTATVIRNFGLVGSWSPDCAGNFKTIFEAPSLFGKPTIRLGFEKADKAVYEVESAEQVTEDKLKLSWIVIKRSPGPQGFQSQVGERWEAVLVKNENKYRYFLLRQIGGPKVLAVDGFMYDPSSTDGGVTITWKRGGQSTPSFEKCLN